MKKYVIGTALALMMVLSAIQVASVTYELYIVWDEQERAVYAGNEAEFNLTLVTTALGPPASTPAPTSPPTTWPTPPPPPEDSCNVNGPSSSMAGLPGALQSFGLVDVRNVYTSAQAPPGWDVELSADTLVMQGEDTQEVIVTVTTPADAVPGLYSVLFTARLEGVDHNVSLPVRVLDPFDVILSNISFLPENPQLGEEITFSADITLDGNVIIPTKTVALYINAISQTKLTSIQVDVGPDSTETVELKWVASQIGDFIARVYVNPTNSETSLANNEVQTELSILPAEDPCSLADQTYALALDMYDEDCESAISTLQVAKALYEQCGNTDGAALCEDLIDKCEQYALAEELEGQGDILATNGDCEGAIAKWVSARSIYETYSDQVRIDSLNDKIDNCVEPEPEPGPSFLGRYWWLLLLLVLIFFLIIVFATRRKEEEEDTTFGLYPSGDRDVKGSLADELHGGAEAGGATMPPIVPLPVVTEKDKDDISKFMSDLEKTLQFYQTENIKQDLKGAINRYSILIDRRNTFLPKMDDATRRHVDKLIKELEDRLFNAL